MAETNRWTRASPIHPATHPRTHCQPTGPGAMQLFGKLRVLYRSSWLACVFLLHRRRLSRLGATTRERLRKGEGGERKTCLCAVARPLLYSSDCRCGLPPVAPSDLAENTQERHLHHRRTILSKEACDQTSRESSSAIETTNQPFNTSTGAELAL